MQTRAAFSAALVKIFQSLTPDQVCAEGFTGPRGPFSKNLRV